MSDAHRCPSPLTLMSTPTSATTTSQRLGIRAVAQTTGIPAETLRTWERRYGFPRPERTPGRHRLYSMRTVERLKLVAEAVARGWRPSDAIGLDADALHDALHASDPDAGQVMARAAQRTDIYLPELEPPAEALITRWLDAVQRFDADALEASMRRAWYQLGAVRFMEEAAGPLLVAVGEAWFEGRLSVAHEHFASERLRDFLTSQWRPLSDRARGPTVLCATLAGEQHSLGLHMVGALSAIAGCRVIFLGADLPVSHVAQAAAQINPRAVLLSASVATPPERIVAQLDALLPTLGPREVLLGGGGALAHPGVRLMTSLRELVSWSHDLFNEGVERVEGRLRRG